MKVNSCHSQVNNREVTIFRKHFPPVLRFMSAGNLTPRLTFLSGSGYMSPSASEVLSVIMGSPFRVFLISQHLKTSIYNLV